MPRTQDIDFSVTQSILVYFAQQKCYITMKSVSVFSVACER